MPLHNGVYVSPDFVDGEAPALSASEMNAMAGAVQGAVEYDRPMELTQTQKSQAVENIGALQTSQQTLTSDQQAQVMTNIGGVSYNEQSLSSSQKQQAAQNMGVVSMAVTQNLTNDQKIQAKANIGAVGATGVTVSVATSAWNGSAAPYTASVTVQGVTANNNIVVGVDASATAAQYAAFVDGQVICSGQGANSITLKAFGDKPTVAIPVAVLILS